MWQDPLLSIVSAVGSILFSLLRLILNAIVHRGVAIQCNKCVDFEWKRGFLSRLPDNEHTAKFSHGLFHSINNITCSIPTRWHCEHLSTFLCLLKLLCWHGLPATLIFFPTQFHNVFPLRFLCSLPPIVRKCL